MKKLILTFLVCTLFIGGCGKGEVSDNRNAHPDLPNYISLEALPKDYSLENARADGCVIMEDGDVTSGKDIFRSFLEKSASGAPSFVRYCHYYTLDNVENYSPEYLESVRDEYPKMYLHDLTYDGKSYKVRWFEGEMEIVKSYRYLMEYNDLPKSQSATYTSCTRYVLTNDNTVTWDDITFGMYSSQLDDYIPHTSVYSDYEYKNE